MVLGGGCFLPKLSQSAGPGTQVWCMNNITIMSNYSTIKLVVSGNAIGACVQFKFAERKKVLFPCIKTEFISFS